MTQAHAEGGGYHILNFVHLIAEILGDTPFSRFIESYENIIFTVVVIAVLSLLSFAASRNLKMVPGRFQTGFEAVLEALDGLVVGILGPQGRKYTPFLGTLFLYIFTMNVIGLFPLMKAPTSAAMTMTLGSVQIPIPTVTVALAILVFLFVQSIGIREQGIFGYIYHLMGSPKDVFGWVLFPLMIVIHVIGELAKPFSLAFRLYGNIFGEDVLLAVFIGLGISTLAFAHVPAGVPFQFPFLFLALATSTVQAFVFTLLSTVYIAMMLPHEEGEHHGQKAHT